jgi:hypothetical protein
LRKEGEFKLKEEKKKAEKAEKILKESLEAKSDTLLIEISEIRGNVTLNEIS